MRSPEVHKRLMLLAAVSLLGAAVARWFRAFLAPSDAVGPPAVAATITPALIACLLLVTAIIWDWRKRGRPHAIYVIGILLLLAKALLNLPISASGAWHSVAGAILVRAP